MRLDRVSRRDAMLRLGRLGGAALSLPALLAAEQAGAATRRAPRAKSCILLYLWGGPAQQDMWDMKPDTPVGVRSEFQPIDTVTPGIQICEHMPRIARQTDKMAIVRSLTHASNDHVPSVYHTITGHVDPTLGGAPRQCRRSDFPNLGSIVARYSPAGALPATVTIPRPIGHDGVVYAGTHAGFLGPQFDPLELKPPGEVNAPPAHNLDLPEGVSAQRLTSRFSLLAEIERGQRWLDAGGKPGAGFTLYRDQALRMLTSPEAKAAFDVEREPAAVRDRYGRNQYGESFLLARRLVEAGVRLVSVVWFYIEPSGNVMNVWDSHGNETMSGHGWLKRDFCLPPLDLAYSALLEDLSQRGLLDETLVAMFGEFGRTPKINRFGGREHWGPCQSAVFAGGGIRGGQVYGSSDAQAAWPRDHAVSPADVHATIYDALGIAQDAEIRDAQGRPYRICDGRPITALFG